MEGKNRPKIGDEMIGSDESSSHCPTVVDKMIMGGGDEAGGKDVGDESAKMSKVANGCAKDYIKRAVTILIGFFHDFATGCWAATVLMVYWLDRLSPETPETQSALEALEREFFYIGLGCIAIVLVAGVGRTFTYAYVGSVYGEDAERLRRQMLIVKHMILFCVFGAGTYWQYTMAFG